MLKRVFKMLLSQAESPNPPQDGIGRQLGGTRERRRQRRTDRKRVIRVGREDVVLIRRWEVRCLYYVLFRRTLSLVFGQFSQNFFFFLSL